MDSSHLLASQNVVPDAGAAKVDVEVRVRASLAHEAVVLHLMADEREMSEGCWWQRNPSTIPFIGGHDNDVIMQTGREPACNAKPWHQSQFYVNRVTNVKLHQPTRHPSARKTAVQPWFPLRQARNVAHLGELSLLLAVLRPASVDPVNVSHELRRLHHLRQGRVAVIARQDIKADAM